MKLALFTPVHSGTSISRDSLWLEAELLDRGHELTIVRTEDAAHIESEPLPFESDIVHWNDSAIVERLFRESDTFIYQTGNNLAFHHGCLESMPKYPGVVILHDYYVADMFSGWAANGRRQQAEEVLRTWYDDETAARYFQRASSTEFMEFAWQHAPMTEWIASMAAGLIAHSNWGVERALNACTGPVEVVPVPARPQGRLQSTTTFESEGEGNDASPSPSDHRHGFHVMTIGHQNRNKRQVNVIRALAGSDILRDRTVYSLVGGIEPRYGQQISALAQRLGVRVSLTGRVDDDSMAQAIRQADVICCLRYPALESASGSAIEAMMAGKPVIVSDVGFYSKLPDTCVYKISPERESEELPLALESIYAHPEDSAAMGARAAEWARTTFSMSNYADRLIDMCERVIRATPGVRASRYFADTLARWGWTAQTLSESGTLDFLEGLIPMSSQKTSVPSKQVRQKTPVPSAQRV